MIEPILSPGEWESLIHQTPDQVRRLTLRLAVFHGHLKRASQEDCPVCNRKDAPGAPEQLQLAVSR